MRTSWLRPFAAGFLGRSGEIFKEREVSFDEDYDAAKEDLKSKAEAAVLNRRKLEKLTIARMDELEGLGITGAAADLALRLSDDRYNTAIDRFMQIMPTVFEGIDLSLAQAVTPEARDIAFQKAFGFRGALGIEAFDKDPDKDPRTEIIENFMGQVPTLEVTAEEESAARSSLEKSLGLGDPQTWAERDVARGLGMSVDTMKTLIDDTVERGAMAQGVRLGRTRTPEEAAIHETQQANLEVARLNLQMATDKALVLQAPSEDDISIPRWNSDTDRFEDMTIPKGTPRHTVLAELGLSEAQMAVHLKNAQIDEINANMGRVPSSYWSVMKEISSRAAQLLDSDGFTITPNNTILPVNDAGRIMAPFAFHYGNTINTALEQQYGAGERSQAGLGRYAQGHYDILLPGSLVNYVNRTLLPRYNQAHNTNLTEAELYAIANEDDRPLSSFVPILGDLGMHARGEFLNEMLMNYYKAATRTNGTVSNELFDQKYKEITGTDIRTISAVIPGAGLPHLFTGGRDSVLNPELSTFENNLTDTFYDEHFSTTQHSTPAEQINAINFAINDINSPLYIDTQQVRKAVSHNLMLLQEQEGAGQLTKDQIVGIVTQAFGNLLQAPPVTVDPPPEPKVVPAKGGGIMGQIIRENPILNVPGEVLKTIFSPKTIDTITNLMTDAEKSLLKKQFRTGVGQQPILLIEHLKTLPEDEAIELLAGNRGGLKFLSKFNTLDEIQQDVFLKYIYDTYILGNEAIEPEELIEKMDTAAREAVPSGEER